MKETDKYGMIMAGFLNFFHYQLPEEPFKTFSPNYPP